MLVHSNSSGGIKTTSTLVHHGLPGVRGHMAQGAVVRAKEVVCGHMRVQYQRLLQPKGCLATYIVLGATRHAPTTRCAVLTVPTLPLSAGPLLGGAACPVLLNGVNTFSHYHRKGIAPGLTQAGEKAGQEVPLHTGNSCCIAHQPGVVV